jgi:hypothetical protein
MIKKIINTLLIEFNRQIEVKNTNNAKYIRDAVEKTKNKVILNKLWVSNIDKLLYKMTRELNENIN